MPEPGHPIPPLVEGASTFIFRVESGHPVAGERDRREWRSIDRGRRRGLRQEREGAWRRSTRAMDRQRGFRLWSAGSRNLAPFGQLSTKYDSCSSHVGFDSPRRRLRTRGPTAEDLSANRRSYLPAGAVRRISGSIPTHRPEKWTRFSVSNGALASNGEHRTQKWIPLLGPMLQMDSSRPCPTEVRPLRSLAERSHGTSTVAPVVLRDSSARWASAASASAKVCFGSLAILLASTRSNSSFAMASMCGRGVA
jgi:hypothetical protein